LRCTHLIAYIIRLHLHKYEMIQKSLSK